MAEENGIGGRESAIDVEDMVDIVVAAVRRDELDVLEKEGLRAEGGPKEDS